ncbi:MAG TPA: ATP-binding cassette domain-containing protein [Acidimicrobiales bacterium]|nr:ATP-binding cassette domain-containing protein [Acidimicrobiales bacterium]
MIRFEAVSKRYGQGAYAVTNLDLEVGDGELCVLVGPSGGGKTTILRMVNRLVEPTSGRVTVQGEDVARVDAVQLRRRTGYVIQQPGLFPHLKVADNVASVPRLLGWDKDRARARVNELLELVGLDPTTYAGRYPHELSGGQAQRVGVARALAGDPPVLLMDEPFAAVDPIARERLQQEFLRLQAHLHKTIIMVTHDVDEAVAMGDRIAVLSNGGALEQYDTPAALLAKPATTFVADFIGADRGLRRLAVTPIEVGDLYRPPVVTPRTSLSEVRAAVASEGTSWAIVLGDNGQLLGWVEPDRDFGARGDAAANTADGTASLMSRARPLEAQIQLSSSLKAAFSEMLQHDAGWVAVLDGHKYLGVLTPEALHAALRRSVGGHPVPV